MSRPRDEAACRRLIQGFLSAIRIQKVIYFHNQSNKRRIMHIIQDLKSTWPFPSPRNYARCDKPAGNFGSRPRLEFKLTIRNITMGRRKTQPITFWIPRMLAVLFRRSLSQDTGSGMWLMSLRLELFKIIVENITDNGHCFVYIPVRWCCQTYVESFDINHEHIKLIWIIIFSL